MHEDEHFCGVKRMTYPLLLMHDTTQLIIIRIVFTAPAVIYFDRIGISIIKNRTLTFLFPYQMHAAANVLFPWKLHFKFDFSQLHQSNSLRCRTLNKYSIYIRETQRIIRNQRSVEYDIIIKCDFSDGQRLCHICTSIINIYAVKYLYPLKMMLKVMLKIYIFQCCGNFYLLQNIFNLSLVFTL